MKNNEYIEKYGEKALEIYWRTQGRKEGSSVERPKKTSKSSHKSLSMLKSKPEMQKIMIKLPSKKKLHLNSGISTPSNNLTQMRANQIHHSSPSTKKKKLHRVEQKLVWAERKRTKSMVREVFECLDVVIKEESRLFGVMTKLRQVVGKVVQQLSDWKQKYKKVALKNKQLEEQLKKVEPTTFSDEKFLEGYHLKFENIKLKEDLDVLKKKVAQFEKKEIILLGAIDQLRINAPEHLLQEKKTLDPDLKPSSGIPSPNEQPFQEESYGDLNLDQRGYSSEQDDHY